MGKQPISNSKRQLLLNDYHYDGNSEADTTTVAEYPLKAHQNYRQMLASKNVLSKQTRVKFKKTLSAKNIAKASLLQESVQPKLRSPPNNLKSIFKGLADAAVETLKEITKPNQQVRNLHSVRQKTSNTSSRFET